MITKGEEKPPMLANTIKQIIHYSGAKKGTYNPLKTLYIIIIFFYILEIYLEKNK